MNTPWWNKNENTLKRLAEKRLYMMKKEAYWAKKRREIERELVAYHITHPPKV